MGWTVFDLGVNKVKKAELQSYKNKRLIFAICMLAIPLLQVAVFYFYVNFSSILLAFRKYDVINSTYSFAEFKNFASVIDKFKTDLALSKSLYNSLILFIVMISFGSFPAILFSYYIYKKGFLSGIFKVFLYAPNIISGVVFAMIFSNFVDVVVPELIFRKTGVFGEGWLADISNISRIRVLCMSFTVFFSFGTHVLLYSGAMSGISDSIIESAKLEGISSMRELFSIVLPMIWQTFVTFMMMSIIGFFTNQMSLYSLYSEFAPSELYTFGYYLYVKTVHTTGAGYIELYPELSALGLLMTLVAVPLTLSIRKLLNKYGPSVE